MSEFPQSNRGEVRTESNVDAYPDMVTRRSVNDFAKEPIDFNLEGLKKAHEYVSLKPADVILDIGCSNASFVLHAAEETQTRSYVIGLDYDDEPYRVYRSNELDASRFAFIQGSGECIPIAGSCVKVTTAHNVLFRSTDLTLMLEEMKRVTMPGGLILISTNASDHGKWRHYIERKAAEELSLYPGVTIKPVEDPAAKCYLENLPHILNDIGGLEIIDDGIVQNTEAIITLGERYEVFKLAINLNVPTGDNLPTSVLGNRRGIIERLVQDIVLFKIHQQEMFNVVSGINEEPYFADTVHRGLIVCRNIK